ncbi:hypothetical protein BGX23_012199, partial [Mortierella sp. AD031]
LRQLEEELGIMQERLAEVQLVEEQRQLRHKQEVEEDRARRFDMISQYVTTLQVTQVSSQANNDKVQSIRQKLQDYLRGYTVSQDLTVNLFGSFESGLCSMTSDADFTVFNFNVGKRDLIIELADALSWGGYQSVAPITNAQVPIIKFTVDGFECDINLDRPIGIVNSRPIATYRRIDFRVHALWFSLRHLATTHGILSGSTRYLSSYALTTMVIRPKDWSLCVKDPFVAGRNVAGNCRKKNVEDIQECFCAAYDALNAADLDKAFKR